MLEQSAVCIDSAWVTGVEPGGVNVCLAGIPIIIHVSTRVG